METRAVSGFRSIETTAVAATVLYRRPSLHAQTSPAFGPACGQHGPATFRSHAGTKAVVALASDVAGLKSAFHDAFPLDKIGGPVPAATNRAM